MGTRLQCVCCKCYKEARVHVDPKAKVIYKLGAVVHVASLVSVMLLSSFLSVARVRQGEG